MSDLSRSPWDIAAEIGGVNVVTPGRGELLLDMDDEASLSVMADAVGILTGNGETIEEVRRTVSKSGNAHVYLRLPNWGEIDPMTRVALQACLGSDRKRELFSILRIVRKCWIPPTVLFEVRQ